MTKKGVRFEQYVVKGKPTKGYSRNGGQRSPGLKDPAGNLLSVLERNSIRERKAEMPTDYRGVQGVK